MHEYVRRANLTTKPRLQAKFFVFALPLRQVAMVAKFLNFNKPRSCKYCRKKIDVNDFHRSTMQMAVSERTIVVIQKFCFHGNVTSHFSSLFDHLERE